MTNNTKTSKWIWKTSQKWGLT